MKIRKGDLVQVISGKDRGKQGEVLRVLPKQERIVIKGVNIVTKHKKNTGDKNNPGGRIRIESPIHVSNAMLVDSETGKPARVGFKIDKNKKIRISK